MFGLIIQCEPYNHHHDVTTIMLPLKGSTPRMRRTHPRSIWPDKGIALLYSCPITFPRLIPTCLPISSRFRYKGTSPHHHQIKTTQRERPSWGKTRPILLHVVHTNGMRRGFKTDGRERGDNARTIHCSDSERRIHLIYSRPGQVHIRDDSTMSSSCSIPGQSHCVCTSEEMASIQLWFHVLNFTPSNTFFVPPLILPVSLDEANWLMAFLISSF